MKASEVVDVYGLARKVFCTVSRLMYGKSPFCTSLYKETFMMRFWRRVFAPVTVSRDFYDVGFYGSEAVKYRFIGVFFTMPRCVCLGDEDWEDLFEGFCGFGFWALAPSWGVFRA